MDHWNQQNRGTFGHCCGHDSRNHRESVFYPASWILFCTSLNVKTSISVSTQFFQVSDVVLHGKDRKEEDGVCALLKEMKINLGGPSQSLCNGTESIRQIRRVRADVDGGPWATTLHHEQNMADVAVQRHKDTQLGKGLRRTFWTWHNKQGGWLQQNAGITGLK